ncbi:hypothetical protein MLD38_039018 [Melastoma candidum]|uniref:Uncharacterized protein n=1 Tax=Melastoma candidum TaxID=119954 RepID=A0ACB9L1F6_9MYRT|nr:hypothetical protein MLD38_039018 [Melastoma candidum]
MQFPQHQRGLADGAQQQGSSQDGQNRRVEQQVMNPGHHAYYQYVLPTSQPSKPDVLAHGSNKDQEMWLGNPKVQDFTPAQASSSKNSSENFLGEKQQGQYLQGPDQRLEMQSVVHPSRIGQLASPNVVQPPVHGAQGHQSTFSMPNNQLEMAAQMRMVHSWAAENNIDLSLPSNARKVAQLLPLMQAKMSAQHKANGSNSGLQSSLNPVSKPPATSSSIVSENSSLANSPSEASGLSASAKTGPSVPAGPSGLTITTGSSAMVSNASNMVQQFPSRGRENQVSSGKAHGIGNGMLPMVPPQAAGAPQGVDRNLQAKKPANIPDTVQMQHLRLLNRSSPQSSVPFAGGSSNNNVLSQVGANVQISQQLYGFTKQQMHVLKAQILAFRRLKKKEILPQELLRSIVPPPLDSHPQHQLPAGGSGQDKSVKFLEDTRPAVVMEEGGSMQFVKVQNISGDRETVAEGITSASSVQMHVLKDINPQFPSREDHHDACLVNVEQASEQSQKAPVKADAVAEKGKGIATQGSASEAGPGKKSAQPSAGGQQKDAVRKYHGPLFDFPYFTRKHDSIGSAPLLNANSNLSLAYDLKDLLFEEGQEVLNKKRTENLKKIGGLLAINLERKRIRPDLVLRLQIEEKKLKLVDLQARLREEVDKQQQEIMAMPDRPYRKFVRLCERQRIELKRQVQASQRASRERQLKSVFQWRKKLLETHWAIRDARTARNRGVAKYHERMLREFSKRKDDDHDRRMEALKNNDVERYREMLLEQQTAVPGDAAERYAVLSSFLTQTEEYLEKLGGKITAAKSQQEVEEAANSAAAAARLQGLSEEEVRTAAACAGEEVMIRNRFMEMNAPKDGSSVSKYYSLAHAINERVVRQPTLLKTGTLRDYQLVGLQWMLSLYNNKLNGILADEMGLGKTVQVMALIAYLMEFKGNYGPHLIIVPNAVLVNWKSELYNWLPSLSCIFYVGNKEQRSKLFSQEVSAMKFNVLVTTYEFIMYDRSKLSKIDWKYIIIDEAQRMKDRESVLARDLDRYRCQRRLLLTGTPLQNDLKELWSLLNLLLPEVFDNKKVFHDWFSKPFQKEGPSPDAEDDWLETEKKVIVIHRLHQILEPFMLRRRVEDVEGSLPPKVSIVLRCKMSAIQSAIYDWIKATGTLRVDPEDEQRKMQKNPIYQARICKTLNNRCMELRKACNHPLLNYPYFSDFSKDFLVKSCGKLWILDRILLKLHKTGHRVLLFSTMTKLLDILEEYLQWRNLIYRRIDGSTSLEDRESAIVDFNRPESDCFIFLLSIRAAGRGLNLQSADTVVIYDPDPNPKNEEQAVARAHRIGQTREVKVIYMEAVVDKISSHQKEDEVRNRGMVDMEDDLAGKDRYMGSIESLIRNNIQQYKIDMADEVINAGRFDQRTTHEERRMTLETLLHDEERYQETVHDVPSLEQVNRMIARSEQEVELFDQMDEELNWIEEMTNYKQIPKWLRASSKEVNDTVANLSKKPSKNVLFAGNIGSESPKGERKRGRPKGKKHINYREVDDENGDYSDASSGEGNEEYLHEEEGGIEEFDNDPYSSATGMLHVHKEVSEEDVPVCEEGNECLWSSERARNVPVAERPGSSGSSAGSQGNHRMASPSASSQKFGSLSALDGRPSSISKRLPEELEEGEIAISGDSHADNQQSESWIHEREEGEDEQVVQPKIKRKRSFRMRPRHTMEKHFLQQTDPKHHGGGRSGQESSASGELSALKQEVAAATKNRRQTSVSRMSNPMAHALTKVADHVKGSWDSRTMTPAGSSVANCLQDVIHRKCKNVVSKLQRRIDKEGQLIVPLLTDLWRRAGSNLLDLRKIDKRVERLEYAGVVDLVSDVQLMLKGAMHFYGFSQEVKSEARKVHNLFFDILRITFPDSDFEEHRSALSFAVPSSATTSSQSPKPLTTGQSKRSKPVRDVDVDALTGKMMRRGPPVNQETTRIRVSLNQKESGSASRNMNSRGPDERDDSSLLAHPGELVVCKKKRKEREKVQVKPRSGTVPFSPAGSSRGITSPGMAPVSKDLRSTIPGIHHQGWINHSGLSDSSSRGDASWANPVKRLRTDSARRRPSHL